MGKSRGFGFLSAMCVCALFAKVTFAQMTDDASAIAKTLTLRLTVSAGSKIKPGMTIAVLPFCNGKGEISEFAVFFTGELMNAAGKIRTFETLDHTHVESVLKELAQGASGFGDSTAATRAAKTRGADALMVGDITEMGGTIIVNARIVSTTSSALLASANIRMKKNADIERMMKNIKLSPRKNDDGKRDNPPDDGSVVLKSVTHRNFLIELRKVYRQGDELILDFTFTNKEGSTRSFGLCRHIIKAYDGQGNVYPNAVVSLAEKVNVDEGDHVTADLPSGVSVKGQVRFRKFVQDVNVLKLVEFGISDNAGCAKFIIKDAPMYSK
jgi:TolB-like protein